MTHAADEFDSGWPPLLPSGPPVPDAVGEPPPPARTTTICSPMPGPGGP